LSIYLVQLRIAPQNPKTPQVFVFLNQTIFLAFRAFSLGSASSFASTSSNFLREVL